MMIVDKKLKVGDILYRGYELPLGSPKRVYEVIERVTKTLAISKNGIKFRINARYYKLTGLTLISALKYHAQFYKVVAQDRVAEYEEFMSRIPKSPQNKFKEQPTSEKAFYKSPPIGKVKKPLDEFDEYPDHLKMFKWVNGRAFNMAESAQIYKLFHAKK